MGKEKKQGGYGGFLIIWLVVSILVGVWLESNNRTGQGMATVVFSSLILGGLITFIFFAFLMVIATSRIRREKQKYKINPPVINQSMSHIDTTTKDSPACNCDGCPNQNTCKYGHVIKDDITRERLPLWTKFELLHSFDRFEPENDIYTDIASEEEMRYQKTLLKLDEDKLLRTLDYLDAQKKWYYAAGKCGIAYYKYMKLGSVQQAVQDALRLKRRIEKNRNMT